MLETKLKNMIGKEVTIGFGSNNKRLVVLCNEEGMTFYASEKGIEIAEKENITTRITPENVKLEDYFLKQNIFLGFTLGKHRLLSVSYFNDKKGIDLRVVYLPDEKDLEYGTSEFMNKCEGRGLM